MKVLKSGKQQITLYYGKQKLDGKDYNHTGIDMVKQKNSLDYIVAAEKGKVVEVAKDIIGYKSNSYGNYIILEHGDKVRTLYAHMKYGSIKVKKGDVVNKGAEIGYMGATGFATGSHLHFEVIIDGKKTDPLSYLKDSKKIISYEQKVKYTIGNYITKYVMKIRQGSSIKYLQKKIRDLTEEGKKNATSNRNSNLACYKANVIFTALEIIKINDKEYWARTPSGYVCIADNKEEYCSKI